VTWIYDDGGRAAAGYKGSTGDCVTRAIAIAAELPYQEIYDALFAAGRGLAMRKKKYSPTPRNGVPKIIYDKFLREMGWVWTPTMHIGSGCKIHLLADELPSGRIICRVSKHLVAVIDGVIHDKHDCSRNGTRCVYGYYTKPEASWA
jgi:hypothetical protein